LFITTSIETRCTRPLSCSQINESIATVKNRSLFVSLNRSHCTEILQWVAKPLC